MILKLPVAYVCWVIWWAVKAEPELGVEGETDSGVLDALAPPPTGPRPPRNGPHGSSDPRTASAHASARQEDGDVSGGTAGTSAGGIFGVAALVLGILACLLGAVRARAARRWCASSSRSSAARSTRGSTRWPASRSCSASIIGGWIAVVMDNPLY